MKKGISPIVAVVLLIAIAVIAAVGLYFWVSAFTTTPATPTPPETLTAACVGAGSNFNGTLFISNTGTTTIADDDIGVRTGTITNNSLTGLGDIAPGGTLAVSAAQIYNGTDLTTGANGTVWTADGSYVAFYCKQA